MSLTRGLDAESQDINMTPEQIDAYLDRRLQDKRVQEQPKDTYIQQTTTTTRSPGWLKPILPVILSAVLSAITTGALTVTSISRELAVEHASVSVVLEDYGRRITDLEKGTVSRGESAEKDKRLEDALKNVQLQVIQTNTSVDEIRQLLYQRFAKR